MTEEEWQELEAHLASLPKHFLRLPADAIHGFLTALVMSHEPCALKDLVPILIQRGETGQIDTEQQTSDSPLPAEIVHLFEAMVGEIEAGLYDEDEYFSPVIRAYPRHGEEYVDASHWCAGFMLGMHQTQAAWSVLRTKADIEDRMWPIFRLGRVCEELKEEIEHIDCGPVQTTPISALQREALTEQLPEALDALWEQITAHHAEIAMAAMDRGELEPAWQDSGSCPCGSGEVFERCCGVQRVLH
jgi:yecA family protein